MGYQLYYVYSIDANLEIEAEQFVLECKDFFWSQPVSGSNNIRCLLKQIQRCGFVPGELLMPFILATYFAAG